MSLNTHELCGSECDICYPPTKTKYPDNNPKSAFGVKKVSVALIPSAGIIEQARVHEFGANKYGPYNWRGNDVTISFMVYLNAIARHLLDSIDSSDIDSDSGCDPLGHIAACCNIILDAKANGNLIDDRPVKGKAAELLEKYKK